MANSELLARLQAEINAIESGIDSSQSDATSKAESSSGESALLDDRAMADKAFKKIIALVNVSDRSERTIRQRLQREDYDEVAIEESVSRAKQYGFIDDVRFAEILIRSRISQQKGSAGIIRELSENGIQADEVPGWPYDYPVSYEEELNRALEVLNRKPPHAKNKRDAAYRRLMQKGYPSSVASSAARMWTEQHSEWVF